MGMLRFAPVGDVVVRKLAGVQPGESVLVVADTGTNLDIAEAYFSAAINAGAKALLAIEHERTLTNVDPVPSMSGALREADVILGLGRSLFMRSSGCVEARQKGARLLMTDPRGMEDYLIEGILHVDYDKMVENGNLLTSLMKQADECIVTSETGTDFVCRLGNRPVLHGDGMSLYPGEADYYPGCQVSIAPIEETINGTIVVDASVSTLGIVKTPFEIKVRDGKVVSIDGGADAIRYRKHIEEQNDPKLAELCHISFGLNPRAKISGSIYEDERLLGGLDIGFGAQDPSFGGTVGLSKHHVDVMVTSPKVVLDGTTVIQDNQLMESLGFHQS